MFIYNEENINKIRESKEVNCIYTVKEKDSRKKYMMAMLKEGEQVKLTNSLGLLTFPFEPLYYLSRETGRFYFDDFYMLDNNFCVNKENFAGFEYKPSEDGKFVQILANFKDGTQQGLCSCRKLFFPVYKKEFEEIVIDQSEMGL